MTWVRRWWKRVLLALALATVGPELLYVVAGNIVLATGLPKHLANQRPEAVQLGYRWALTPWPGRVYVRDFALRFQDPNVALDLTMATSRIDVSLIDLFSRKFCARHARGTGVSYRMLLKVDAASGMEERLAAFPPIDGVARPPLKPDAQPEPALTAAEIDRLWSIEFNDVDSEVDEVWLFEYRYRGRGHSHGAFGIAPLKQVWVGPVSLTLDEGTLSVGPHVLSDRFSLRSDATITPFDISKVPGLEVFKAMTGTVQIDLPLTSLAFATVYLPGAKAEGGGTLSAQVHLKDGRLEAPTALKVDLPNVSVGARGFGFQGAVRGEVAVTENALAHAALGGTVFLLLPNGQTLAVAIDRALARASPESTDLSQGVQLGSLHASVNQARAADARPLVALAATKEPLFLHQLLGDGPLTASGTVDATRHEAVVRISKSKLGAADLRGAVAIRGQKLRGAVAGHAESMGIGAVFVAGRVDIAPFIPEGWLEVQLALAGINAPSQPAF